ncbi:hypothetical protein [Alysiella crassa]|uniref:Uncharacterized protein n=1 Tax=Alysiella crassa TaxID=153491 RepID=A0A376BV16_9NEIS|nr:hypothetical protein [Alysiella crassa]UOP06185.1 hypothetical protein LVJ80_10165 [Alysiella crassa]SSY80658.1 Uncharacterised protein [Alysiella crassa]
MLQNQDFYPLAVQQIVVEFGLPSLFLVGEPYQVLTTFSDYRKAVKALQAALNHQDFEWAMLNENSQKCLKNEVYPEAYPFLEECVDDEGDDLNEVDLKDKCALIIQAIDSRASSLRFVIGFDELNQFSSRKRKLRLSHSDEDKDLAKILIGQYPKPNQQQLPPYFIGDNSFILFD